KFLAAAAFQDRIDNHDWYRSSLDSGGDFVNDFGSRQHSGFDRGDLKIIEQRGELRAHGLSVLVLRSENLPCVLKGDDVYDGDAVTSEGADGLHVGKHARAAGRVQSGNRHYNTLFVSFDHDRARDRLRI